MFEVETLKSLGLEVTGMRKRLDIIEHVVPIVISYKMNSIYKRNVSKFYKFPMFEVVTLKILGLEVTGMRKWLDIDEHVVTIVISYRINSIYKRNVSKFYNYLMFEVVTSESVGLEVTGMRKGFDIVEHVVPIVISYKKNRITERNVLKFYNFLMFDVVTLKSLGLEVTGMRKWLDVVEYVVPIVISYKMNSIFKRNVSKFYNFPVFEVVTLESSGLESTGMRKWLDIVEHEVPIVISYKMNSIYGRNVSKFYKFPMFEVVTLKILGLEVTGMRKWLDIDEHVVTIVISYRINSIYKRNVSKFYNFLMFEVVTSESVGLEVTGMRKGFDIVEHVVPIVISYKKNRITERNVLRFYNFLMFDVVTLKNLGLEVTGMRKWLDVVEYVVPIVISYKMNSIFKRNVSKFYNFPVFEVVTLKSLGLEVTGMRKWLDIVEHEVPIVISYKMNSIYGRNVSKFYKFPMFEVVTLESLGLEVTGMRKWLDIVEHVVSIVISYKMNSITRRNVSKFYNFLMGLR